MHLLLLLLLCTFFGVSSVYSKGETASGVATGARSASQRVAGHVKRLVVVGNILGDYGALNPLLISQELMDSNERWTGQDAVLIFTGNLIDGAPYDYEVLSLLKKLRPAARARGGDVVTLLGTHELANVLGLRDLSHPGSFQAFGGFNTRRRMFTSFGPAGSLRRQVASEFPFVFVSERHAFVHSGLRYKFAMRGAEKINSHFAKGFAKSQATRSRDPLEHLLIEGWYNQSLFLEKLSENKCGNLHKVLEALDVDFLVFGTSFDTTGHVESSCDGRALNVNVGLSRWVRGSIAALEISIFQNGTILQREVRGDDEKEDLFTAWHHPRDDKDEEIHPLEEESKEELILEKHENTTTVSMEEEL